MTHRTTQKPPRAADWTPTLTEWVTTEDVAEYLQVPTATVRAWRARGVGPIGFRAGKHVRYKLADIDAWVTRGGAA